VELGGKAVRIRFVKNERLNTTHFVFSGKENYAIANRAMEITIAGVIRGML
jgi:hypothetical protein